MTFPRSARRASLLGMDTADIFRTAIDPDCQLGLLMALCDWTGPRPDLALPDAYLAHGLRLDELPIRPVCMN